MNGKLNNMTNTAETIQNLTDFRENVREKMLNREIVSFNIGEIQIEGEKMILRDEELSPQAIKKILSHLRVKNNFLGLSSEMNATDWNLVKEKLKMASRDQAIHGRKIKEETRSFIDDVYLAAPKTTGLLEIDSIFNEVIDSVVGTGKDIGLKSTFFLEDKDEVSITLLEHDSTIDAFGNGEDLWKTGKRIVWNGMNFSVAPFFERLVCTNGNTAPQFGFKANISNNKFNIEKIKKILEKEVTLTSDSLETYLVDSVNHLKHYNVSVREFMKYRNMFNETNHSDIIKKWLDDSKMNRAYGCIVSEMPELWKTTADSGKNAYDFFNDLTYIASHPDEAAMTNRERMDVQIKASDLLFKKDLDLELVAPKPTWK
jgi:hypothetical protein